MAEEHIRNEQEIEHDPVDALIEVRIEAGGVSAKILVHPPINGGKDVSKEMIYEALFVNGVTYGVIDKNVSLIELTKKYNEWIPVAICTPAQDGKNGKVEYLFEEKVENLPTEDAKGYVDYKNLGTVRNITRGTVIAHIIKETEGEQGTNVRNEPMIPKKGNPPKVTFGENIGYSEDGLALVVQADGNLVFKSGRFSVETVFKLDGDVDVSTGNIDFIGEVIIRGDVREGFSVKAKRDVTIQGGVFNAKVEADGNLIIRQGSIGSSLSAGGKVEVDFAENSSIKCTELLKTKSLYFCNVFCNGEISCSMGNGSIVGGNVTGTKNISALNIGSRAYTVTTITVGDNAIMMNEKNGLIKELENINAEIDNCQKIIEFLNIKFKMYGTLPREKLEILRSANNTVILKKDEMVKKQNRIDEIDMYLQTKQNLYVSCRKELNPGVKITINDQVFNANMMYQHCNIGLGENGIEVTNL